MKQRKADKNRKEEIKNTLKMYTVSRGLNYQKLTKLICEKYPDASADSNNLRNKINNGTIKFFEVLEIADILDYDLVWKSRS